MWLSLLTFCAREPDDSFVSFFIFVFRGSMQGGVESKQLSLCGKLVTLPALKLVGCCLVTFLPSLSLLFFLSMTDQGDCSVLSFLFFPDPLSWIPIIKINDLK